MEVESKTFRFKFVLLHENVKHRVIEVYKFEYISCYIIINWFVGRELCT